MDQLKETCFQAREQIEAVKAQVQAIRTDWASLMPGEIGANVVLAFRHLEDAKMRMGKAIQAIDGGTSCYPR